MIIDYEEFQELLQWRWGQGHFADKRLLETLVGKENVDDEAVKNKWHKSYREIAAIVLLHRRYGSWERLIKAMADKYPFSGLKEKLETYRGLDQFKDSNIRKIGNRLSVNNLVTVLLWYNDSESTRKGGYQMCYPNTVCALNKMVSATVRTALDIGDGFPLNVNTMGLGVVIAMLECLTEAEWDNLRFYYSKVEDGNLDKALLILEAMDASLEEITKGRTKTAVSILSDIIVSDPLDRYGLDSALTDYFDRLVDKPLEMLEPDGYLALILYAKRTEHEAVQQFINEYMAKGQIRGIFDIPSTEYASRKVTGDKLIKLRCIVFSVKSDNDKVQVIDFSDLLEGKDYKVLEDQNTLCELQKTIEERFNGNGNNVTYIDKEFFLGHSEAYNPCFCNIILYLEKMLKEGKGVSLEQLMGKEELPERLVKEGIAVPEMLSIFRPVAIKQLERAKKRQVQEDDQSDESGEMVYIVGTKHLRDGSLFVKDEVLDGKKMDQDMMKKIQRYILQPGDLLISRIGGTFIALVTEEDIGGRLLMASDSLHIIRCNKDVVKDRELLMNTRFIYMYLSSQAGKRQLNSLGKGQTLKVISLKELSKIILPADPEVIKNVTEKWYQINEARRLIDSCFAECDKLLRI